MNRIPTEGLKPRITVRDTGTTVCLNEQNPDRGIETYPLQQRGTQCWRLNEQNPDRGIETTSPQLTPRQAAGLE